MEVIAMELSLHDARQIRLCLRRRAALARHDRYAALHEGRALTLLPLRGNIEGRPTRCWLHELAADGVELLSRDRMEHRERFLLRLPREGDTGLWLRCRALRCRPSEHDDLYLVSATFESEAEVVGLRDAAAPATR
jgi:hypothetical protein